MAKKRLTDAFVRGVTAPGRYGDGGRGSFGLSLLVKETKSGELLKNWHRRYSQDELNKQKENLSTINQRKSALDEQVRIDERALDAIKGMGDLDSIQAKIHEIEEDVRHLEVQETGIRRQMKELLRSEDLSKGFIVEQLDRGNYSLGRACGQEDYPWKLIGGVNRPPSARDLHLWRGAKSRDS